MAKRYSFTADIDIEKMIGIVMDKYSINAASAIKMLISEGYYILQEYNRLPLDLSKEVK